MEKVNDYRNNFNSQVENYRDRYNKYLETLQSLEEQEEYYTNVSANELFIGLTDSYFDLLDDRQKVLKDYKNDLNNIKSDLSDLKKSTYELEFKNLGEQDKEILEKLNSIEKSSDNSKLEEGFKELSNDLVKAINDNNKNNISILVGVIIGISIVSIFLQHYNKGL